MVYDNRAHGRMASLDSDHEMSMHSRRPSVPLALGVHRGPRRKNSMQHSHPKPPLTPNTSTMAPNMANPLLPSAPASPPTPAPSPTPHQLSPTSWPGNMEDIEDPILEEATNHFGHLSITAKERWLRLLVDKCDNQSLSFLHQIVSPRLKKDPFKVLPNELCFRVSHTYVSSTRVSNLITDRYSNSSTIRKHLSVLYRFREDGVR